MSILEAVVKVFAKRLAESPEVNEPQRASEDKYGILSPILTVADLAVTTERFVSAMGANPEVAGMLKGTALPKNPVQAAGVTLYKKYTKKLERFNTQSMRPDPLELILNTVHLVQNSLDDIQDNFESLFGSAVTAKSDPSQMKITAMIAAGFVEMCWTYLTFVRRVGACLTGDAIRVNKYTIRELEGELEAVIAFTINIRTRWNPATHGFINEIRKLRQKGLDASLQSNDLWIDSFLQDRQFSVPELSLMASALRSPITALVTHQILKEKNKMDLLRHQKSWLVAKIAVLEAETAGMDPSSPDYKRLSHAVDYYAGEISKIEAHLERLSK